MTALVLATRSRDKAAEIDRILGPLGIEVETLDQIGLIPDPAEEELERFDTFRANAIAKARWFADRLGRVTIADDSGLRVDALGGRPGVHTKRFSGRADLTGEALDRANNDHLLGQLGGVLEAQRGARYVCCAAIAWPEGGELAALGTVSGRIGMEPRGDRGFGYDPLFHVPELGQRFAEVSPAGKDAISHRARAFRALAARLASSPWPLP